MLLLACAAQGPILLGEAPEGIGDPPESIVGTGDPPPEDDASFLFTLDAIHAVDLTWDADAQESLERDGEVDVHATLTLDGTLVEDVALHVKGNLGSERGIDEKAALKIDFNDFVADRRVFDLEKLTLNNMVSDPSYVHERLTYQVFLAAGIPAPRVGYAWVRVNGEDFGLYANVETPDDRFLDLHYADTTGNLYEGGHVGLNRDGSHQHADFTEEAVDWFMLDEGADVGLADVVAITTALDGGVDASAALVDWPAWHTYFAVEVWVGDYDGYGWNANNYRVYFDPETTLAAPLPWGMDAALTYSYDSLPNSAAVALTCALESACRDGIVTALGPVCDAADALDLEADLDAVIDLIDEAIVDDPRREVSTWEAEAAQDDVRDWLRERSEQLRRQWGL